MLNALITILLTLFTHPAHFANAKNASHVCSAKYHQQLWALSTDALRNGPAKGCKFPASIMPCMVVLRSDWSLFINKQFSVMRSTKKASGKSAPQPTPRSLEERFQDLAATYGTQDPEQIKQRIMWRYIEALAIQNCTEQATQGIKHHSQQFDLCNRYIEHQCAEFEKNRNPVKAFVVQEV
jgi:hypothetical protein